MAGSAAPLVQSPAPGHTVPGVAPSSKFTKANDPLPPDRAACTLPSRAGESGRPVSQDANSRMHPTAIKLFMAASASGGRWLPVAQLSHQPGARLAMSRARITLLARRNESSLSRGKHKDARAARRSRYLIRLFPTNHLDARKRLQLEQPSAARRLN